jgi:cyanophycin synthetase
MRILERNVYVGPSMYAHFPVIKLLLDLGPLEQWPSGKLGPAFVDALVAALPGLQEHGCSYQVPGGLIRRMREKEGTWLGHVLEHVAIELQNIAGEEVSFGKTRSTEVPGVYTVVYEYAQRDEGIAAGELGIELLCSLLPPELRPPGIVPQDWNWQEKRDDYIRYAQRRALGPSTASLVKAAEERNIPWLRLNEQSLIQLGHGKYQQRVQATVTSRTSHIAVELAQDKEETNKILANCGLPVPRQELVRSPERAVRAAERLGYPVVTKPFDGNHGRGISIGLAGPEEVRSGYAAAAEHSGSVIVETYLQGDDHRRARSRGQRPYGHPVRQGPAYPVDVDALDPGDARGARDAQRAKCDVRRRARVFARHQARCHTSGIADIRQHLLPGAGTHERL